MVLGYTSSGTLCHGGEAWRQQQNEAAGHVTSTVTEWRGMNERRCSALFFFHSAQDPSPWGGDAPHSGWDFPSQFNAF